MKRKIALLAAAIMLGAAMTGCSIKDLKGGAEENAVVSEVKNEDILSGIDSKAMIDAEAAKSAFEDALAKSAGAANITINNTTTTSLGPTDNSTATTSSTAAAAGTQGTDTAINVAEKQTTTSKTIVKKNVTDDASKASCVLTNEYSGSSSKIEGFYDGSVLYYNMDISYGKDVADEDKAPEHQKLKETMTFDDFMSVVSTYELSVYANDIKGAACIENEDGSKKYIISYDQPKLVSTMTANMEAGGGALPEGQTMTINYSNIVANVDKDGYLTDYGFIIDAYYQTDDGKTPYSYVVSCDFADNGSTVVDEIAESKKADYKDASEIQNETATEAENPEIQTEIVTGSYDPNAIDPNAK